MLLQVPVEFLKMKPGKVTVAQQFSSSKDHSAAVEVTNGDGTADQVPALWLNCRFVP